MRYNKKLAVCAAFLAIFSSSAFSETCASSYKHYNKFKSVSVYNQDGVKHAVRCDYYDDDPVVKDIFGFYLIEGNFRPVSGKWSNDYSVYSCFGTAESCVFERVKHSK